MTWNRPQRGRRPLAAETRARVLLAPDQERRGTLRIAKADPEEEPGTWIALLAWEGRGLPPPGLLECAAAQIWIRQPTAERANEAIRKIAAELGVRIVRVDGVDDVDGVDR